MAKCGKNCPMSKPETVSEENGTTTKLLLALARLDAEFTAATCGLNDEQFKAVNEMKDISFELRQSGGWYRAVNESCLKEKHERVINSLFKRGLIDETMRDAELLRYRRK